MKSISAFCALAGVVLLSACTQEDPALQSGQSVAADVPAPVAVSMANGASEGNTVRIHYTLTLDDGTVFESTSGGEPRNAVMGNGMLLPGLEKALTGMRAGEKKSVTIPAADAFGPYRTDSDMVQTIERASMPHNIELKVGMRLNATVTHSEQPENAFQVPVTVTGLTDDTVTIDANHPLAGKDLHFDIQMVEIL